MHKKILEHATDQQVREFATDFLSMLKATNEDLYDTAENWLYKEVYGCHFNEWSLEEATAKMINEDGTTGAHWSIEETNYYKPDNVNKYDWNYVMNMVYSDYYGAVNNDVNNYVKLATKFISDKDAPDGKAYKYYINVR